VEWCSVGKDIFGTIEGSIREGGRGAFCGYFPGKSQVANPNLASSFRQSHLMWDLVLV